MRSITSTSNDLVKQTASLLQAKYRSAHGCFLVEGARLVDQIPPHIDVKYLFVEDGRLEQYSRLCEGRQVYSVSKAIVDKVSDTVNSQGIVAVCQIPAPQAPAMQGNILVLDGISDAGNLGNIIRTCAAFGVLDVMLLGGTDAYSPKCVRSSMGGIFFTAVHRACENDVLRLRESGYTLVAADMDGRSIVDFVPHGKLAILIGNEAHGLSPSLKQAADTTVAIPIKNVESLNAAVAAALVVFAATKGN